MEVNVIDDWANVSQELATTRASHGAALYHDHSRPPTLQPSAIIREKPLEETKHPDQTQTCPTCRSLCLFSLYFWPSAYLFRLPLHHLFCFCLILLWLPCVVLLVPNFPFHFIFLSGSIDAWLVFCHRCNDVTWSCAAYQDWGRRRLPDNAGIIRAVNLESADINCVVDCHFVWEIQFDGVSAYSEDLVWANVPVYQYALCRVDIGVCGSQILCI